MKKWLLALLACLMTTGAASAQTYTFSDLEHSRTIYMCEDFESSLPESAQEAFADALRAGDEGICGAMIETTWQGLEGERDGSAVLALRRDGKLLLLGAAYDEKAGVWKSGVESDSFLPEGKAFSMMCMPDYSNRGVLRGVDQALSCGEETFVIEVSSGGMLSMKEYIRMEADGAQTVADYNNGSVTWKTRIEGEKDVIHSDAGPIPSRLCAWAHDTLVRSPEESAAWAAPLSFDLAADQGYLTGVNLRERPTGQSESFGIYRARVRILGQRPGPDAPWFNVRVGNLEGWASGRYLKTENPEDLYALAAYQTTVHRVGRAKTQAQLLDKPDGEPIMTLAEGALVHVIMDHDGWLHVIAPHGELTWQTDWDGVYGFVKAENMAVGISAADVMYR